jgi:hypothetical protein
LLTELDVDLDQALIWCASRRADLVRDATAIRIGSDRLTWMRARLATTETGIAFVLSPDTAVEELLGGLRRGEIKAYADEQTFEPRWFNRASIINAAIKSGSPRAGEHMVFVRERDQAKALHEFDDETRILRTKDRAEFLRFDAADLLRAFPPLKADAPKGVGEPAEPHVGKMGEPSERGRMRRLRSASRARFWKARTSAPTVSPSPTRTAMCRKPADSGPSYRTRSWHNWQHCHDCPILPMMPTAASDQLPLFSMA